MQISTISDLESCKLAWDQLSPHQFVYDDWDFRFVFYKYFQFPLRFFVAKEGNEVVGLLPLQLNTKKNILEFFGGQYMDINRVFIKPGFDQVIPTLYQHIDQPADFWVSQDDEFTKSLPIINYNYYFDLSAYEESQAFLQSIFSKKTYKHRKNDWERIEKQGVRLVLGDSERLEDLIKLNVAQFGAESSFLFPHRPQICRDLLNLPYNFEVLCLEAGGQTVAVSVTIIYGHTYHLLSTGSSRTISGLGTYLMRSIIASAFASKCTIIDLGSDDCGWKERWNASKAMPQHQFKKYTERPSNE